MRTAARKKFAARLRALEEDARFLAEDIGRALSAKDDGEPPGCAFEDLEVAAGHLESAAEAMEPEEPEGGSTNEVV